MRLLLLLLSMVLLVPRVRKDTIFATLSTTSLSSMVICGVRGTNARAAPAHHQQDIGLIRTTVWQQLVQQQHHLGNRLNASMLQRSPQTIR